MPRKIQLVSGQNLGLAHKLPGSEPILLLLVNRLEKKEGENLEKTRRVEEREHHCGLDTHLVPGRRVSSKGQESLELQGTGKSLRSSRKPANSEGIRFLTGKVWKPCVCVEGVQESKAFANAVLSPKGQLSKSQSRIDFKSLSFEKRKLSPALEFRSWGQEAGGPVLQAGRRPLGVVQAPRKPADVVACQLHHSEMEAAGGSGREGWLAETKREAEEGAMRQQTWRSGPGGGQN